MISDLSMPLPSALILHSAIAWFLLNDKESCRPFRIRLSPKDSHVLVPLIPSHLLPFLGGLLHNPHTLVLLQLLLRNPLKEFPHPSIRIRIRTGALLLTLLLGSQLHPKMPQNPMMILFHIGNGIQEPTGPQSVGVLSIERLGDNPGLVLAGLEVRVREANENLGKLVSGEEIREEFHGIAADCGDVFIGARDESGRHVLGVGGGGG